MTKYLVTGGSGFIGSNFIHYLYNKYGDDIHITNVDKLTYAGNPENLRDVEDRSNYQFIKSDICDAQVIDPLVAEADIIVNFAAESHVDRSIGSPDDFIKTDVYGTFVLLEAARKNNIKRFVQISTDEVYGSILDGAFKETDMLQPSSPYSASKAGADRLAFSYFVTYDLPVLITRCSNNYGMFQYPEKLISLFVTNAIEDKPLPVYGDGKYIRDWIYVLDHCDAIDFVIQKGDNGQVYNIGGGNERTNLDITYFILNALNKPESLITYVKDRPGHDRRYAVDMTKINNLGWKPAYDLEKALTETIQWYQQHPEWWQKIKSGEYLEYYRNQYQLK